MIYLQGLKKEGEISRETLIELYNISSKELEEKISNAKNRKFKINSDVFVIDTKEAKKVVKKTKKIVEKGIIQKDLKKGDIYKTYKGNIAHLYNVVRRDYFLPKGTRRVYICNGEELKLSQIAKKLKMPYDYIVQSLRYVDSFECDGNVYKIKYRTQLYDLYLMDKKIDTKITMREVVRITDLVGYDTINRYADNNWYTKDGYRIKRSKM